MSDRYDLVVLGAGSAGERGAAQAAYFGKRVAVIECEDDPGGATVHTGTLPSKTLREAALFVSGYRQRDLYGISIEVGADLEVATLIRRKDAVRRAETARIRTNLARHGVDLLHGEGRFTGPHAIEVREGDEVRTLEAEFVLIATGSHPHRPAHLPFDDPRVYDSDTILAIDRLPRSLLVLGGGVIGCEYASMFAALGVEVHLVEPRVPLLPFLDREIVDRLEASMRGLGVTFHLGVGAQEVRRVSEAELRCALSDGAELHTEAVLASMGRSGATEGLDVQAAGVEVDGRGRVVVDADYATSAAGVYAAGDVIGFPALASASMEQARVAVCHAFGFTYKREVSSLLPFGVYTIPEVSSIGLSEDAAAEEGIDVVVGRASFAENARGRIIGDTEGMTKLVFDRGSRRLLGTHVIGERASELVHVGHAAMILDGTVETLIEMVFNHPTLTETYKYAAYDALGRWDGD